MEDDPSIIHNLSRIIISEKLGQICGDSADGMPTTGEILGTRPDVILMDFFMPQRDGIEVITDLRAQGFTGKCVMLSQVSDKTLIGKAYSAGINFFISKPINLLEVRGVLQNVTQQVANERTLASIRSMFSGPADTPAPPSDEAQRLRRVQNVLGSLGMSGEKGSADILKMCGYLYENHLTVAQTSVGQLCEALCPTPKNMEQRARRAVAAGMVNLAHMGCEDYTNETFARYSGSLFPFEEIRAEMDHIRGRRPTGGKVSLKKFLDGLMIIMEE
ncbi:MAG: response regulator [Oscillospiraceae bacterium]|nr:response regulator [Oscillospiraceae bacterium]